MKTMRNLFLLCAGLSLFACSSDDDATQQFPEGKGAITIKVTLPETRSAVSPTDVDSEEDKVSLEGTIYVELTAATGGGIKEVDQNGVATFYGITEPSKVEAYVNGGKYVYTNKPAINLSYSTDPDFNTNGGNTTYDAYNMQAEASGVPAYGFVTVTEADKTNNSELYDGTSYQMYEAAVTMEILVARIEYPVNYNFEDSKFDELIFQGAYLDNIKATPDATKTDYRHENDVDTEYKTTATGDAAILYDYPISEISFVTNATGVLPEADKVYAYNIYPNTTIPYFKLWFNGAESSSDYVVPYQYAVVNSYNSGTLTELGAGVIYKVNQLTLTENNLATAEDGTNGDIKFGIDVTVTEAQWSVDLIDGSWSQN